MDHSAADYDARYLGGILFFNRRDFFEAHEVWEDLWMETATPERRFYQALIQAAVALYHFSYGNIRGAVKLFHSSREYMQRYESPYLGLDTNRFWQEMGVCFQGILPPAQPGPDARPREDLMPVITLEPAPTEWPNPDDLVHEDE